jgi:hypothetical protein
MTDDINAMTPQEIIRLLRTKAGTPQRLNEATQAQIDATLTFGNIRTEDANEEVSLRTMDDYFNFGGKS